MKTFNLKTSDIYDSSETLGNEEERFERLIALGSVLYQPTIVYNKVVIEKFTVINARNLSDQKLLIILRADKGGDVIARWKSIKYNYEMSSYYSRKEDALYIAKEFVKKILESCDLIEID